MNQCGGVCIGCGAKGVNIKTCPNNPDAKNKNYAKHNVEEPAKPVTIKPVPRKRIPAPVAQAQVQEQGYEPEVTYKPVPRKRTPAPVARVQEQAHVQAQEQGYEPEVTYKPVPRKRTPAPDVIPVRPPVPKKRENLNNVVKQPIKKQPIKKHHKQLQELQELQELQQPIEIHVVQNPIIPASKCKTWLKNRGINPLTHKWINPNGKEFARLANACATYNIIIPRDKLDYKKSHGCINDEDFMEGPFDDMDDENYSKIIKLSNKYCYHTDSILRWIVTENKKTDPYTNKNLEKKDMDMIKDIYIKLYPLGANTENTQERTLHTLRDLGVVGVVGVEHIPTLLNFLLTHNT